MRRILMISLATVAALMVVAVAGADTKTVQITRSGFTPSSQTVAAGDTITWHNADTVQHQVVADDGSFASPQLKPDATYSFTFQKSGNFAYHDSDAPAHRAAVTVNAAPAAVALTTPISVLKYGSNVTVRGSVSNNLTNEPVTLTSQPAGSVKTTITGANGAFSFNVAPTVQTIFTAHWRTSDSTPVTLKVSPLVGFGHSGHIYTVKVTSDLNYEGHFVWAQRRQANGLWHNVKRVFLGANSNARFKITLPHGRSVLRLNLPAGQAGAGYVSSVSRLLTIFR
jgi:plastocyanin